MSLKKLAVITIILTMVGAVLSACNTSAPSTGKPQIVIQSPSPGETIPVNETIVISAVATDPDGPGVASIEVFINGESTTLLESPSGPLDVFDMATTMTSPEEGQMAITLIAYREDGTPSPPATLVLTVSGMTLDPAQTVVPTLSVTKGPTPTARAATQDAPSADDDNVQARVIILTNIRSGPGPFCDIIGFADEGDVIKLLEVTRNGLWFKTDFLGEPGWVYLESFIPLDDETVLPVSDELGCPGCGDNLCNAKETCDDCPEDCGLCCGNAICEPGYGEDCQSCEADCGPCCGNGTCEPGLNETCNTCPSDCGLCCGNGLCEEDFNEDCATCPGDCGLCCGNGLCEADRNEDCSTCAVDCGACPPTPTP